MKDKLWSFGLRAARLAELIFFPSFCRLCQRLLDKPQERVVCQQCYDSIRRPAAAYCWRCGRFFAAEGEPYLCLQCQRQAPPFSLHRSCTRYEGKMRELILLYKYAKLKVVGRRLANLALDFIREEEFWAGLEVVVPVPLHPQKQRERGFNQSLEIARVVGRARGLEVENKALIKIRNNPPQASLEAEERRANVKGAYQVKRKEKIKDKVVLLVDDVFTTGSTIEECSRVLKQAGAKEVRALTLAQA